MTRFLATFILFLFPFISVALSPAYLTSMQIQPSPTNTKIIFSFTKKTDVNVKYFSDFNRIVLQFANAKKRFTIRHAKLANANVESISSDDFSENTVRVMLDVAENIRWKTQNLKSKKPGSFLLQLEVLSPLPSSRMAITPSSRGLTAGSSNSTHFLDSAVKPRNDSVRSRIFTIVIDPGHGGKDTGAIGPNGVREKNIVLAVAKRLAALINRQKNMRAILTRHGDYYVTLRQRLKLARKGDADLFIAIHADAHFNKTARGVSVFALSQHGATTEAARWLAQKDTYLELDDVEFSALQDKSKILRSVLIDLAQTVTIQDSVRLGASMIQAFKPVTRLHYRHVERAPFVVLKSPDIPSVLIETGFVSNPKEAKKLVDPHFQETLAKSIYKGVQSYARINNQG